VRLFDAEAFSWRWKHEDPRVDGSVENLRPVQAGAGFDELRALADRGSRSSGESASGAEP